MNQTDLSRKVKAFDDYRNIVVPGNYDQTIHYAIENFIHLGNDAISQHKSFAVALSGGSTPKAIYQGLASGKYHDKLDWSRVLLFWSDERNVPPDHTESNYHMAMECLKPLNIPEKNIFRMEADRDLEDSSEDYEELLYRKLPAKHFDLVMLGMGEDGHTASLFPRTHGLHTKNRWVTANFVPQLNTWRMSLTFDCINEARHINIYVLGKNKADMVAKVLKSPFNPDNYPIQNIGKLSTKALWVLDSEAAKLLS